MRLKILKEQTIKPVPVPQDAEVDSAEVNNQSDISETILNTALQDMINSLVQEAWAFISAANSSISTIDFELKDEATKAEVSEILNTIVDDTTISIGMLHKINELLNSNDQSDLLAKGQEKAEEIIKRSTTA